MNSNNLTPVIKWVGGKRQLLSVIHNLLPDQIETYYEPFFGGGALFCSLQPEKAVINDFNHQLIAMYCSIQQTPAAVEENLLKFENTYNSLESDVAKTEYYYHLRSQYNCKIKEHQQDSETAALVIFLNKAGFNGLYRVNQLGVYNVPSAHKKTIHSFTHDNLFSFSHSLYNKIILCGDFEEAVKTAVSGDFVFFDSPYFNTFDNYQSGGFSKDDHLRLASVFHKLTRKGVNCMLTNSNTDFIRELYGMYNLQVVPVKRMINCNVAKRTGEEVIVTNYNVGGGN